MNDVLKLQFPELWKGRIPRMGYFYGADSEVPHLVPMQLPWMLNA